MADRREYFFRQKVSDSELDAGFAELEEADFRQYLDADLVGIMSGQSVVEAGPPDLTVDINIGTAYDKAGKRLRIPALQNLDVSVDENSVSTAVAAPGNEKILAVFLQFDRTLTDPRTDGNSNTVFFVQNESFKLRVVQGAEALPPATPPPVDSTDILLADVTLIFGQTTVVNADIDLIARREFAFNLSAGALTVQEGTPEAAAQGVLTELNTHINDATDVHAAAAITFTPTLSAWNDATALVATNVQTAVDEVVDTLATASGALKIGATVTSVWFDTSGIAATSLEGVLDEIVSDLGGATGGTLVGFNGFIDVTAAILLRGGLIENNTWTGDNTFEGLMALRNGDTGAFGTDWAVDWRTETFATAASGAQVAAVLETLANDDVLLIDVFAVASEDGDITDTSGFHTTLIASATGGSASTFNLADAGADDVLDIGGPDALNQVFSITTSGLDVRLTYNPSIANDKTVYIFWRVIGGPSAQP